MNIKALQTRYNNGKTAIKYLEDAMPTEDECVANIYMERNGEKVKNNFGWAIILASVEVNLNDKIFVEHKTPSDTIASAQLPYIVIRDVDSKRDQTSRYVKIPVEAIKPLINVLEGLIKE